MSSINYINAGYNELVKHVRASNVRRKRAKVGVTYRAMMEEEQIKTNEISKIFLQGKIIKGDTAAYGTYLPLYLYYNHIGNQELSKKYINLAYESIGEEDIRKYHEDPNRETNPKRFYSRDIIKAYENN